MVPLKIDIDMLQNLVAIPLLIFDIQQKGYTCQVPLFSLTIKSHLFPPV